MDQTAIGGPGDAEPGMVTEQAGMIIAPYAAPAIGDAPPAVGDAPPAIGDAPPQPKVGWPDRIQQGNALLRQLFPDLVAKVTLPTDLDYSRACLLVAPWEGATSVLITFGGNTGYLMLPAPVVTLQNTHLIAIRDPLRCFALCGVPGLGENYADCIANLRRLIAELGGPDIYCAGVSSGGYPALRYGLDLGANGVLGFSAPTTLDLADDPGADLSRYPQLTALYRLQPGIALDLARLYAGTLPRPRAILLFSPSNDRDTWLADRMRGIEGVEIDPVDNEAGHRVFVWLNAANAIPQYFDRLLTLQPVEAPSP